MNFIELLEDEYDIQIVREGSHHCSHGWVQFDCPFCGRDSNRFHMGYNLRGHYVNCWKCGGHTLINTLIELTNQPARVCVKQIKELNLKQPKRVLQKHTGKLIIPNGTGPLLDPHIKYLKKRGYVPKEIERLWNVQGIGIGGKFQWRLFIPFIYQHRMVSWTTRSVSDECTLRYRSASVKEESISHKELLYGEDFARFAIVICEGPLDVWKVGPGAVATMGTGYSTKQVQRMTEYPIRAVCFDSNDKAQKRAKKLCNELSMFDGETHNIKLDSDDPGTATKKELDNIRRNFLE